MKRLFNHKDLIILLALIPVFFYGCRTFTWDDIGKAIADMPKIHDTTNICPPIVPAIVPDQNDDMTQPWIDALGQAGYYQNSTDSLQKLLNAKPKVITKVVIKYDTIRITNLKPFSPSVALLPESGEKVEHGLPWWGWLLLLAAFIMIVVNFIIFFKPKTKK
jgi:hypothetical protein